MFLMRGICYETETGTESAGTDECVRQYMNEIGVYARSYIHYHKMWHKVVQCWIVGRTEAGIRVSSAAPFFEKNESSRQI